MGQRADIVIIGSGILGLSAGFHLLLRDRSLRVLIVEREASAGKGSTGKATGGIRHQFAAKPLVYLSKQSIDEYRSFREFTGVDAVFEAIGYLLLATTERSATTLATVAYRLNEYGVQFESPSLKDLNERWPYLSVDKVRIALFTPGDGRADPHSAVTGYLKAFRALSGRVSFGEAVLRLNVASDRITGVQTNKGAIDTSVVVNAAGVRAAEVAGLLGLELPVRPFRRQVAVVRPSSPGVHRAPFIMEVESGWNFHQQRDGAVLLGGIDKDTHPGTDEIIDPNLTERVLDIAAKRIPRLEEARLIRSYVGARALTPDDLPVLGPVPGVEGFYCLCGFAGHGFMHAPAAGDLIAQWILNRELLIPEVKDCLPGRFVRFH